MTWRRGTPYTGNGCAPDPPVLKLTPILLAIAYAVAMYLFSAWRLKGQLDARSVPLADPRLAPVFRRLAGALDLPALKVNLYEIEPVNGLAAPDGRIFLTRGFYEQFRTGQVSADELASVVAHELGHVALGHSRRRMVDFSGQNAIRVALAMVLGRILPGIGIWIANLLAGLLAARLSRQDEYEADAYAAALMTKAGLGVEPQVRLLEKLQAMHGMAGRPPVWLASHPDTADRIEAIRRLEAGWAAR
jgi:metalloprotease